MYKVSKGCDGCWRYLRITWTCIFPGTPCALPQLNSTQCFRLLLVSSRLEIITQNSDIISGSCLISISCQHPICGYAKVYSTTSLSMWLGLCSFSKWISCRVGFYPGSILYIVHNSQIQPKVYIDRYVYVYGTFGWRITFGVELSSWASSVSLAWNLFA